MSLVAELSEWVTRTLNLKQVKDVLDGWDPPEKIRLLCRREGRYVQSEIVLSLAVDWHRLNPEDFVEPA